MFNLFRFIGFRNLQMKPVRAGLTIFGVMLGVALYVAIQAINRSTLHSFKESVESVSGKAALTVSSGESGFSEKILDKVKQVEGVAYAVPMVESRAFFSGSEKSSETLFILGVDLLQEQAVRTYRDQDEEVIDDPLEFLNSPDSIIVTKTFAQRNGLEIDSTFDLATVDGPKTFTVRGLLSPTGPAKAYGGSLAIMDIDGASLVFGKEGKYDRIDVVLQTDFDVHSVAADMRSILGQGFFVDEPETKTQQMQNMVRSYQQMLGFFSFLSLLVGVFLVANSVGMSVAERKREIGTLRALGATKTGILGLFLFEAVVMGLLGSIGGIFLGRLMASNLVGMVAESMTSQYLTKIEVARLIFDAQEIKKGLLIGTLASLGAALWPSFKATFVSPLEAMNQKNLGEGVSRAGYFRLSLYVGVGLLLYVFVSSEAQFSSRSVILASMEQAFTMIGAALVGPAIVAKLIRWIRPLSQTLGDTVTRLSQDNLLKNPHRTGSNVMSLLVGLIFVTLLSTVNKSFKSSLVNWYEKVLASDILVSANGRLVAYQVPPISESIAKEIEEIPGIKKSSERGVYGMRYVKIRYQDATLAIKAFDKPGDDSPDALFDVVDRPTMEARSDLYDKSELTVMVSENFVLHFGKKTGDKISLQTPTGLHSFKVVGVIKDFASSEGVIYMDRSKYRKLWNDSLVTVFGMKVRKGFSPEDVRRMIDQRLGRKRNLMTVLNMEMRSSIRNIVDDGFKYIRVIEFTALLVALLGLLNTFLVSVMERTREFGVLRAVGMSKNQMRRMVLQESLFQGTLGAVVAVGLGSWLAYLWVSNTLTLSLGWVVDYYFPWEGVGRTLLAGLLVTLVAGIFPAKKASEIQISEALEYE